MNTPLHPRLKKRITDAVDRLIQKQVTPWLLLMAGPPLCVPKPGGGEKNFGGCSAFAGAPMTYFWSPTYMKLFLEDICIAEIDEAVSLATKEHLNVKAALSDVQMLLSGGCLRVYLEMGKVHLRLMAAGSPQSVRTFEVGEQTDAMDEFIQEQVEGRIKAIPPPDIVAQQRDRVRRDPFFAWPIIIIAVIVFLAAGIKSCLYLREKFAAF